MGIFVKIRKQSGFSLIELLIVIAIMGITATMATYSWLRYVDNSNLRTAARQLESDIKAVKGKAMARENIAYTMSFDDPANTYTTTGIYTYMSSGVSQSSTSSSTVSLASFGSGIIFSSVPSTTTPPYTINFMARGTLSDGNTVTLINRRDSSASITFTLTGKTYVTFNMR
jgi:prepilin-type N-terminal cleavage/methylation domain-containing protein